MFQIETITLKSGTKLNYASENFVKNLMKNKGIHKGTDNLKHSDLTTGVYEG